MDTIKTIEERLQSQLEQINPFKRKLKQISKVDFAKVMQLCGNIELKLSNALDQYNRPKEFEFFDHLKPIINFMYEYTTTQSYNINSGIGFCGAAGICKTITMKTFLRASAEIGCFPPARRINARTFHKLTNQSDYYTGPLFIEEFGKGPKDVKDFGTEEQPVINLLMVRYETRELTFMDSNKSKESLDNIYGPLLKDRFKEIFYFIESDYKESKRTN